MNKEASGLPFERRKLLGFTDNRQDAALQAGNFNFHSDTYQWLVINQNGTNAQFKGSGTINGDAAPDGSDFLFMIWATDSNPDTFRIKIWWSDNGQEQVVYDTGVKQQIGGGSIKIHQK